MRVTGFLRTQRGTAAIELAIVTPIFVMLMMATSEIGRALYQYNTLNKQVRMGAQYMAKTGLLPSGYFITDTTDAVYTTAKNLVVYGKPTFVSGTDQPLLKGMTTANVTITPVTQPGAGGPTYVTVTATYSYLKMFNAIPTFGNGTVTTPGTMTASLTMVGL